MERIKRRRFYKTKRVEIMKLKPRKSYFKEIKKGLFNAFMKKSISCEYALTCKDFGSDLCWLCDNNDLE